MTDHKLIESKYISGGKMTSAHGLESVIINSHLKFLEGLTLVDLGCGSGTVLASIIGKLKFPRIIAADPDPKSFDMYQDEKLARYEPVIMDAEKLKPYLTKDNTGLLLCWPFPNATHELAAIKTLEPKRVVLMLGYSIEEGRRVTSAGSAELWNKIANPDKNGEVTIDSLVYKVCCEKTYVDVDGKAQFDDCICHLSQEERDLYTTIFELELVDRFITISK